ncbi:MAG: Polyketide cyclase / dehydrase and lipid transport [Methanosaeta sp. PtaB.Bin039]|nr:MAG: Polyketide cyclase / dehydrase and lipid transport [Methanosaeta sp. PtaB.Bin039]HOT06282.1 SRPBCC domain-containing protein [Methanotrichaceae archaeon]HQF15723.1 SRPBCC domain-containing protein [Methanotrichaceae archaeon]HQI90604.1 SRPBCC domain-containing protein [Methanotrichaceae archaeon]
MSKHIVRMTLGIIILLVVLYIATLVAANTTIAEKSIQTEVVIDASPSRVWQVLTDFEAYPQWNPFIRRIKGEARPGEQLTAELNVGDLTMTFQPTILIVQPERELRWIGRLFIPGVFDGEHGFIIEQLGRKRVRFVQSESFKGILVPFSGGILKDTERSFQEMNRELKERAEGQT